MFDGIRYSTFSHVNSKCYIAHKLASEFDDNGNEITQYEKPQKYMFNIQPLTGTSDVQSFGENVRLMKVAVITNRDKYEGKFKEFDLAYLDGATPDGEKVNGEKANYRVYSVQDQNVVIRVFFIKLA